MKTTGPEVIDADVVIAGSGCGGSLLAAILSGAGLRTVIFDRGTHPRFAIGESSTPSASLILGDLAQRYSLDWLAPLANAGAWHRTYPGLIFGVKRGFSYYHQQPHARFLSSEDHARELLVMASASDERSDTHWLRSDVDEFCYQHALRAGAIGLESVELCSEGSLSAEPHSNRQPAVMRTASGWQIQLQATSDCSSSDTSDPVACRQVSIRAGFLIDATGAGQMLFRSGAITGECTDLTDRLVTRSRAIFGHVENLPRWGRVLSKHDVNYNTDYPFDCDDAALHHILSDGWMWWLRFCNDVTSVGLVLNDAGHVRACNLSTVTEWQSILEQYPSLCEAFATARWVAPVNAPVRTGRMQRLLSHASGRQWAMLPYTAGFIDPLHSTGIAHTLSAVERLAPMLIEHHSGNRITETTRLTRQLSEYSDQVVGELRLIDLLVSGVYHAIGAGSFRRLSDFTMCYFAAATTWEHRRLAGRTAGFLLADDDSFVDAVRRLHAVVATEGDRAFHERCLMELKPFDSVGLFAPPIPNMHGGTALPKAGPG